MNKDVSLDVINHSIQNSILHAMPGGIFIYRADTHDILYANDRFLVMLGYDSLEALTEKTGIPLNELTGVPFTVERTEYVSYWGNLAKIQYFGDTDSLCYCKSPGTEDNSGDYTVYAQEETLEISGNAVTLKGNDGAYSLAVWTDGSYAYSISVTNPLSEDAFRTLIEENV